MALLVSLRRWSREVKFHTVEKLAYMGEGYSFRRGGVHLRSEILAVGPRFAAEVELRAVGPSVRPNYVLICW